MLLVGGFGCLELCLLGIREMAYNFNQLEHSIRTNASAPLSPGGGLVVVPVLHGFPKCRHPRFLQEVGTLQEI